MHLQTLQLQQQLSQLQKIVFGSKHERFVPEGKNHPQLSLDIQAEPTATATLTATRQITYTRNLVSVEQKPMSHPGRMKLPESLRREAFIIEPQGDLSSCKKMGEEIPRCWTTSPVNCT